MVLRAKIDMASPNINMRDPAIYRIRRATHHNTGDTWCIYPMYTYAHPIEDALEQITHSLCTLEFEDQRPFYDWLLDRLCEGGLLATNDADVAAHQVREAARDRQAQDEEKRKTMNPPNPNVNPNQVCVTLTTHRNEEGHITGTSCSRAIRSTRAGIAARRPHCGCAAPLNMPQAARTSACSPPTP